MADSPSPRPPDDEKWSEFVNRWRVFPRIVVAIFIILFVQAQSWAMDMIERGILTGEWIGPAFVGAWVAGFVKLAQDYAKTGGAKTE